MLEGPTSGPGARCPGRVPDPSKNLGGLLPALVTGALEKFAVLVTPDLLAAFLDYAAHLVLARELSPRECLKKGFENALIPDSRAFGKGKLPRQAGGVGQLDPAPLPLFVTRPRRQELRSLLSGDELDQMLEGL